METLRSKYITPIKPVVIMSPLPMSMDVFKNIANFPDIYFIQGIAMRASDLVRAGVFGCANAVILSRRPEGDTEGHNGIGHSSMGEKGEAAARIQDADQFLIFQSIQCYRPVVNMIAQLQSASNISYLMGEDRQDDQEDFTLSPPFAAGKVFISSALVSCCASHAHMH